MVGIVQRILHWRASKTDGRAVADLSGEDASFSPVLLRYDVCGNRVSFWRRLLCAAEVSDTSTHNAPFARISKTRAPSVSSTFTAAAHAAASRHGSGASPELRSVFANPSHRFMLPQHDEAMKSETQVSCTNSLAASTRWVVLDTRRMATELVEVAGVSALSPDSSFSSWCPGDRKLLQQLKQAKKEQLREEALRKKDLQRDEESLLEEERQRLRSTLRRTSSPADEEDQELPPCGAAPHHEALLERETAAEAGDVSTPGLSMLPNSSIVSADGDESVIEGDDGIDIQDLNRLYDFYKRRDEVLASREEALKGAAPAPVGPKRKARQYPLHSRQYVERVILAQRSQQTIALMWLLAESMHHAWRLHVRLAQLYVYYVPMYLHAATAAGCADDGSVAAITQNRYYNYFCSSTFDYEYYMYQFSQEWDALFTAVKSYIAGDGNNSATSAASSSSSGAAPPGSVGVAATVLYSMELFGRQHELQVAVREVERWVWSRWQRMNADAVSTTTTLPSTTTRMPSSCVSTSQLSLATASSAGNGGGDADAAGAEGACESQLPPSSPVNAAQDAASTVEYEKATYMPMDWWQAQDADVQAHVSWNRKKRKLRQIRRSAAAMRNSHRLDCGADQVTRAASAAQQQQQQQQQEEEEEEEEEECFSVSLDATFSEDSGDDEPKSHRVVNVGCFGFSFFSRWD